MSTADDKTHDNTQMGLILKTSRTRLREFRLDDAAFIIELLNSPGWLAFIGQRNVKTRE